MSIAPYPIIERQVLSRAEKERWYSRKSRKAGELPRPDAHQSLVYRVGGDLIVDEDRMSPADERIVSATNVSVVDMRRDAPVVVMLQIPSVDASYFEVLVTFTCTVTDAASVVSGGINAHEALWGHLKAHNRIFELGLDYALSQVNEVRRVVGAQVKAYLTHVPARVAGMRVRFANVEVNSPKVLVDFEDRHRSATFAQRLDLQEQQYLHRKETGQAQHVHGLATDEQHYKLGLDGLAHAHEGRKAVADTEQELHVLQRRSAVARSEFDLNVDMINGDPRRALIAAYAAGQLDAQGLASGLKAIDDSDREATMHQALRSREEQRELRESDLERSKIDRDWRREEREQERDERRRQEAQDRVDRLRMEKEAREDAVRRELQDREDRLRQEQQALDEARRLHDIQVDVLRQMTAQGHLNTTDLGAGKLFAEVLRVPQGEVGRADLLSVEGRHAATSEVEGGKDTSPGLRDEDV